MKGCSGADRGDNASPGSQDFPTLHSILPIADGGRLPSLSGFLALGPSAVAAGGVIGAWAGYFRDVGGLWAASGNRPDAIGAQGRVRAATASRRSSRRRVSARLSRRLAKITASTMLLRLARFAGQAGVFAEDAVSVVHVFHGPRPQQFLWRRVLRIERGDDVQSLPLAAPLALFPSGSRQRLMRAIWPG